MSHKELDQPSTIDYLSIFNILSANLLELATEMSSLDVSENLLCMHVSSQRRRCLKDFGQSRAQLSHERREHREVSETRGDRNSRKLQTRSPILNKPLKGSPGD